jgi:carboxyl-terminal processing protease
VIRTTLEKRYDYSLANLKRLKGEDVFQLFMNAYATSIDPHTNYLGPKATEDFDCRCGCRWWALVRCSRSAMR